MRNSELQEKTLTKARNTAYRLLTYRPRSRAELESKLRDRDFSEAVVDRVIADLARLGYLNERLFAEQWAAGRARVRGLGRRRIEQELKTKGVDREIIRDTLGTVFGDTPELDIAKREAVKKVKSLARAEPAARRRRLAGFLERKGFSSAIIGEVLRMLPQPDPW